MTNSGPAEANRPGSSGTVAEVFVAFLRLGLTAFGGPVAHLGYFRETFVVRRRWLGERAYADLVALCQFLPGPASSQVGMAIGLGRAGYRGLLAAWCGFTLPSAVLLTLFAFGVSGFGDAAGAGWIHGLKAAAVAVVAQAVLGMAKNLIHDRRHATIATVGMIIILLVPSAVVQVAVIAAAGMTGILWLRPADVSDDQDQIPFVVRVRHRTAITCLSVFVALLAVLPVVAAATGNGVLRLTDTFYRAGALVFGGGHVVLPLLQAETVATGLVDSNSFLAGYGAAQAVPGPLFTFSAYLGAVATTWPTGVLGASIALVAIFVPSALLIIGALPFWTQIRHWPLARRALAGVNAGVVGLLAAALYTPVFTSAITGVPSLAIAVAAFVALTKWSAPPWAVVIVAAILGQFFL